MSRRPNIEALRLYRDILRRSRSFYWPNDKGEPWNKVLQESARKEFEQARYETDPLIVARLLVVGRDALMQLEDKVAQECGCGRVRAGGLRADCLLTGGKCSPLENVKDGGASLMKLH